MTTFIENLTKIEGYREVERFILKNLTTTKDAKIWKTKHGWTVTFPYGTKWYVEFDGSLEEVFFDEEINGKGSIYFPAYIHVYKEDRKTPLKEVVLYDIINSAYRTHKLLKA